MTLQSKDTNKIIISNTHIGVHQNTIHKIGGDEAENTYDSARNIVKSNVHQKN